MKLHNTIIYLIGIPAVGKYTVAKEIGRMTEAKVVDNQLINTPVYSVIGYDGTDAFPFPRGAAAQIEKIHRAVLTVIRDYCPPDASFVFTNTLDAREPLDWAWFRRIERLAKQRKAGFFPVWLTCEAAVIRRRKNTPDRKARLKDIDLTNITRWSEEVEVLRVPHPNALTVDTSYREPRQTAQLILEHVQGADQVGRPAAPGAAPGGD
jgi:adenylylsulfate kinase-like enzyme